MVAATSRFNGVASTATPIPTRLLTGQPQRQVLLPKTGSVGSLPANTIGQLQRGVESVRCVQLVILRLVILGPRCTVCSCSVNIAYAPVALPPLKHKIVMAAAGI